MSIYSRLQDARKYRHITQARCAEILHMGQSLYGRKEKGAAGGLKIDELEKLSSELEIDAGWLFGQMDVPIEEADLRLRGPEKNLTQQPLEEIQELRKRTRPLKELDPLAQRVITDAALRRLVELLIRRRSSFPRIQGYLEGLEEGRAEAAQDAET
jgi:transcriptional regulator with XRE-family HTH domain